MNAGAARILEGHQRDPVLQRDAHHIDDLARVHLAEGAGGDGEILTESSHLRAGDIAGPRDYPVRRQILGTHAEVDSSMTDIGATFLKGVGIEQ